MVKYVLASGSPRRSELLEQIGLEFEISPAHGEEKTTKTLPADIVEELSAMKALEAAGRYRGKYEDDTIVIIGADTVVAYEKEILGKPHDVAEAVQMLTKLQNNTHQVYTGVTLVIMDRETERQVTFSEKTEVHMYPMTEGQIRAYAATGDPLDKAGAYAIQGRCAAYIKAINGEYNNVVGLPVARLMHELQSLGLENK